MYQCMMFYEILQKIESEFVRLSASLPADCPFNVERDVYGKQEQFKKMESVGRWSCLFCGKSFYDEVYLDKHFDRKHSNKIPQVQASMCPMLPVWLQSEQNDDSNIVLSFIEQN